MKPDMKTEAKMKMLQELKKMATDMMGGELKGKMDSLKKVTVAAPDEASLKEGLDKAKDVVGEMPEMESDEDPTEEATETPSEENAEEMSPEEMAEKIKELQAKLEMMKK